MPVISLGTIRLLIVPLCPRLPLSSCICTALYDKADSKQEVDSTQEVDLYTVSIVTHCHNIIIT